MLHSVSSRQLCCMLIAISFLQISLDAYHRISSSLLSVQPSRRRQHQSINSIREDSMFSINDVFDAGSKSGMVLTTDDVFKAFGKKVVSLGMPRVIIPQNSAEDFLLWFHMRDESIPDNVLSLSTGRILCARSKNGVKNWEFPEDFVSLSPSKEAGDWFYFDSEHVGLGDVIQPGSTTLEKFTAQGNVFLMYTFGGNADIAEMGGRKIVGSKMEVGVCVSQDGLHWSRIEGPSPYGSILEVGKNPEEDFDGVFLGWPTVMEIGSKYRMYYNSYDSKDKRFKIGMAEAPDGLLNWNKKGVVFEGDTRPDAKSFDSNGASRRHVLRQPDGSYKMYYEAVSHDQKHSIGVAVSADGVTWERCSDEPVFAANSDSNAWDGGGVGSPHLVYLPNKDRWRMYYIGNAVKQPGEAVTANAIGFVESEDADGMVFKRA